VKRPFLIAAVAVVAASNAYVLLHAAMNRRGAPDAELALTTRELRYNFSTDSPGSMTLSWQTAGESWFDQQKLKETGFDVSVPPDSKGSARYYSRSQSREVFVVLEFEGAGWQKWLEENRERLKKQAPFVARTQLETSQIEAQWLSTASRLVAIDVGLDPDVLRRRYPDRQHVMILRGVAEPTVVQIPGQRSFLQGRIAQILTQTMNLPAEFRGLPAYASYVATLRVGRRYEPWIAHVRVVH
jgi:hypothetical protein